MARVSVELVPRSADTLKDVLTQLRAEFPAFDVINIPELLRFEQHSWEWCDLIAAAGYATIPHVRAIDIDISEPLPMKDYFIDHHINEVLVVTGDPPQDFGRRVYPTVSTDVIAKFRDELPQVKVYAVIDQYRGSMRQEEYMMRRKLQAGAAGFFTQPFYDLRYMEVYADMLEGQEVFWGVSPVVSERSVNYWETKNNVIFPKDFRPTMEWNIDFAKQVLDFCAKKDASPYFRPIQIDVATYLAGVWN